MSQTRIYSKRECIHFRKTTDEFGGLSNMAGGFRLEVNGIMIYTSEALYQSCRFPQIPEVQKIIISQASPMTAKMKSKPYRNLSRHDWMKVRVKIMRWCLRVKLAENWESFSELLLATGDFPIVEDSRRDGFWGAIARDEETFVGINALGRLLMEVREEIKTRPQEDFMNVKPLDIDCFCLMDQPIREIDCLSTRELKSSCDLPLQPRLDF